MKVPWLKIARVLGELVIDAVTGKLERKTEPMVPLTRAESQLQSRYARMAGPPCDLAPPGWQCSRYRGHTGPCAAYRRDGVGD
jgi:hypothetical protein